MSELIVPKRRYSVAISYRRKDGSRVATRLRNALRRYRFPAAFEGESLREIYFDRVYQRADPRFFDSTIKPALADSDHLLVIVTPAVFERGKGGQANWVEREVAYFRDVLARGDKILIARADAEPGSTLPSFLADYDTADQVDLRGLASPLWRWVSSVGGEVARIVATLIDTKRLPELRREEERDRMRRIVITLAVVMAIAATTTGLAVAAWLSSQAAQRATVRAEQKTIDAFRAVKDREAARLLAEAEKQRAEDQKTQAENARLETRRTFARADLETATDLVEKGETAKALAYLARAVRSHPDNVSVRSLIYDLLLHRHWAIPVAALPHEGRVETALMTPRGDRLITVAGYGEVVGPQRIRLWRMPEAQQIGMPIEARRVQLLRSSADGSVIFAGSPESAWWIIDARDGRLLASKRQAHYVWPRDAAFSPTAPLIAVNPGDESLCVSLFDYDGKHERGPFCHGLVPGTEGTAHPRRILASAIAFSPDGRHLATGADDLRIWDVATGEMIISCRNPKIRPDLRWIKELKFIDAERLLVHGVDGITLWTQDADCTSEVLVHHETEPEPDHFAWLRGTQNYLTVTARGNKIRFWHSQSERDLFSVDTDASVGALSASSDGMRLAVAAANVHILSTRNGKPLIEPIDSTMEQFSSDGATLLGINGTHTMLWNVDGEAAVPLRVERKTPEALLPTPPPVRTFTVTVTDQGAIHVIDISTGNILAQLTIPQHRLDVFAVSDAGLIAIGAGERTILWNYRNGERTELRHGLPAPQSLDFTGDGSLLLMHRWTALEMWSVPEKRMLWSQSGAAGKSLRLSDDDRIVIEDGYGIRLFYTTSGEAASSRPILEGESNVRAILSPDNTRLFAGNRMWDRIGGRPLGTPFDFEKRQLSVAGFTSDGEQLAASIGNETYMLDVPDGEASDAPYLADLAERVGGWKLDSAGQLLRVDPPIRTLDALRALVLPSGASEQARKVAAWFVADRRGRTAGPWTRDTMTDLIRRCQEKPYVGCAPIINYIPDPTL